METIIKKLEQYQEKNGFDHTNYSTRKDSSGDIREITFKLSGWLGQVRITKDIASKHPVFKDGSKINLLMLAYFGTMLGYYLQQKQTSSLMFSLVIGSYIVYFAVMILREIKITDLKRFLFE
ncbi:hypothetical protein FM037_18125 [Shewanella psychropiezotolerans]|uniref:Uncharacterized protein n=1 Tax=Shewanella psychropiezotolerans TaxID=2593655 RepID=A0ABX5X195_9GAMM|nr:MULTISPECIES: hypothetical protein [Shewanella]MPY21615.1 hypothetical protein [Shewanella sp. YLB-07]QDO84783.1 hypothetical protein FM037_18125 [Shewanella psychropiezotolerans]